MIHGLNTVELLNAVNLHMNDVDLHLNAVNMRVNNVVLPSPKRETTIEYVRRREQCPIHASLPRLWTMEEAIMMSVNVVETFKDRKPRPDCIRQSLQVQLHMRHDMNVLQH